MEKSYFILISIIYGRHSSTRLKPSWFSGSQNDKDAIENEDLDCVRHLLDTHLPKGANKFQKVFMLLFEEQSNDLKSRVVYVQFDTEDLYDLIPNTQFNMLKTNNIEPEFANWNE